MPALERRDISREQKRARARGTADSEGCCLVQSLREIDKESTTVSSQLGHRLRTARTSDTRARMHAEISPSKLGLLPPCQRAQMPLRRTFKRAHFVPTPSAYPLVAHANAIENQPCFYPDTADFPFCTFPFPRHALRNFELHGVYCNAFHPSRHFHLSLFLTLSLPFLITFLYFLLIFHDIRK